MRWTLLPALAAMLTLISSSQVLAQSASILTSPALTSPSGGTELAVQTDDSLHALPADASLLDAWLQVEQRFHPQWAYAFVQAATPTGTWDSVPTSRRLAAELQSFALQTRLAGDTSLASAALSWRNTAMTLNQARLPGRFEPTWLMNNLRHVPKAQNLAALGWCQPPAWVEVWSHQGVRRVSWRPAMTTTTLLDVLPEESFHKADHAHVVSPLGEIQSLGIAAWNYQSLALAPGSRVVISLPGDTVSARWLDTALPRFLSTRLPGDDCLIFPLAASASHDSNP